MANVKDQNYTTTDLSNNKKYFMDYKVPAGAGIGHVHLKVTDLERLLKSAV